MALPAAAQVYGGAYVQFGPPAPIYETVPVSPGPAYYWVPGYWNWNGYRYVWIRGRYAYRPYGGAIWHSRTLGARYPRMVLAAGPLGAPILIA